MTGEQAAVNEALCAERSSILKAASELLRERYPGGIELGAELCRL